MYIPTKEFEVCIWVGFAFGMLSLILSLFTLYIIYRMCQYKLNDRTEIPEQNPMTASLANIYKNTDITLYSEHQTDTNVQRGRISGKGTKFNGYMLFILA